MKRIIQAILAAEIDPAFAKRAAFIFEKLEEKKSQRILDAGCGRGFYVRMMSFYDFPKEIHGIDINTNYLEIAKKQINDKRIHLHKASIYHTGFEDNYFDFIICSEVVEHLTDDYKALLELRRVLKPNGVLIITVPNENFPFFWDPLNWFLMRFFKTHVNKNIWWLAGIWADHERLYTENDIQHLIQKVRFQIKKIQRVAYSCLPFSHFLLYGIGKNLVERFEIQEFNRFSFKKRPLSEFMARLFRSPSISEKKYRANHPYVTIFLVAEK